MNRVQGKLAGVAAAVALLSTVATAVAPAEEAAREAAASPPLSIAIAQVNSRSNERTAVRGEIIPNIITGPLIDGGGPVQTAPIIYVVYWGWTSDPSGERTYLQDFLSTVGGNPWLNTVGQYSGAGNPTNLYGGAWSDASAVPAHPTDAQIQAEAVAAVHHFGLGTSVNIQIVVATPTGHSTTGFGVAGGFCAYHGKIGANPNVTYTNLPYITDAGSACGANSVSGPLDGVSIVEGHELAESITDPLLNAWKDASGNEIGDKCAWTDLAALTTSVGTFAVQPLWSNAANGCVLGAPLSIGANTSEDCPLTLVTWSSVAGATSYELYEEQGNPPWFGAGGLVYTGTATQKNIRTGNHLNYLWKVEACTASGCSPLSIPTASGASPSPCP